jgi:O-antigen/teichoic acid export membrane protein
VGKVNFGNSIVSYFSLVASLGVTTYAIRECSKVRDDKKKLEQVASQIISINICTTIIAYLGLLILLIAARPLASYRQLIIIQSTNILFTTLGADWLNTAMEDFKYITLRTVFFQVVALVLMFIFVQKPEDYLLYAIITVVSTSGGNIINIFYRRRFCKTHFTLDMDLKKHFSPIIKLFAMLLSQQIFCNSDTTMLGLMHGDYEVGLYSTSVKIYNIINSLMSSITWVVMPKLSYAFLKKDYSSINELLRYALNFIVTLGFPCVVGMNLLSSEIIEIIAGPEYIEAAGSLRILAVTLLISLIWGFVMNIILLPSGQDTVCLVACAVAAVFNLITNFIFIPKYGILAAATTTAFSQLIGLLICVHYVDKEIKLENVSKILLPPIVGSFAIAIIIVSCTHVLKNLWLRTGSSIVISVFIYFLIQILLKNDLITGILDNLISMRRARRK